MINKKKLVVILIFLIAVATAILMLLNKFNEVSYETKISTRAKNISNVSVLAAENSYEIKNNTLVKNYDSIIKNVKEISLSVIDDYAFFFNNEGYVRFDLETEEILLLNYDVMDFAAAGLNYIYYTADENLYKLGSNDFCEKVASDVYEKLFIYENSLYYIAGNTCYEVNLLDDIVNEKLTMQGKIKEAVMTSGQIIVVTNNDLFKVRIKEDEK